MKARLLGALLLFALPVALLGCGNGVAKQRAQAAAARHKAVVKAAAAAKVVAQEKAAQHEAAVNAAETLENGCEAQIHPLLHAEQALDARLDVGMNYQSYTTAVGNLSVAYHQIQFDSGPAHTLGCLGVGEQEENAFNQYIDATNVWTKCFDDPSCSTDSIQSELNDHWQSADSRITAADAALSALRAKAKKGIEPNAA
jgi:hypothetical protein